VGGGPDVPSYGSVSVRTEERKANNFGGQKKKTGIKNQEKQNLGVAYGKKEKKKHLKPIEDLN